MFSQATEELGALADRADQKKRNLASDVEKASAFMKIYRGDKWDGSRVKIEGNVEQIEQRVRCCTACHCSQLLSNTVLVTALFP